MLRPIVLSLALTLLSGAAPLVAVAQDASPVSPTAAAAPPTPATSPAGAPSGDAEEEVRRSEARNDRRALFEARLAALRAGLLLTPEQEKMWPAVETAIRDFVAMRSAMADRRSDQRQDTADDEDAAMGGDDPIAALKDYSDGLLDRGRALKVVADSAAPLWAAMSEEQKHRLPRLLREMNPRREARGRGHEYENDQDDGMGGGWRGHPRADSMVRGEPWRRSEAGGRGEDRHRAAEDDDAWDHAGSRDPMRGRAHDEDPDDP